ncbi:MAG: hypothetical protein ACREFD_06725 [Stellaceae bacterium]
MVGFAYRSVFGRLGLVLDLGWIMLLVLMAVLILPGVLMPGRYGSDQVRLDALNYGQAVVALLSLSAFAVRWHQSILVGDPHRQPPRAFFRAWLRFLAYGCIAYAALGVLAVVALGALAAVPHTKAVGGAVEFGAVIAAFFLALGLLRFGLMFPAAASGVPLGPVAAWRLMRGNTWRLAIASILAAVPITFIAAVLTALVVALALPGGAAAHVPPPIGFTILAGLIETAANFLLVALGASLLSAFYRELMARHRQPGTGD